MPILPLGPVGTYEALPANGDSTFLVGDPADLWSDLSDDTYADMHGNGFDQPWGHPYAEVPGLTLSPTAAASVTEVTLRWRIKFTPGVNPPADPTVVPYVDVRTGAPGTNFPSNEALGAYEWWEGDYTVMRVTTEWQWRQSAMVPGFMWDSLQEFLTDPRPKYVAFYISSSWADEHFQISEVEISINGEEPLSYRRIHPVDRQRNYPPPKSFQRGSRRGGGYL